MKELKGISLKRNIILYWSLHNTVILMCSWEGRLYKSKKESLMLNMMIELSQPSQKFYNGRELSFVVRSPTGPILSYVCSYSRIW